MLELAILITSTNTMKQAHKIVKIIQEMEVSGNMGIGLPGITESVDRNFRDQIKETHNKLKRYCEGISFVYVNNVNINEKSLNKSLIHLYKTDFIYINYFLKTY